MAVVGYVLTSLGVIGRVYTDGDASSEETAIKGKAPLWSIKAHYIDSRVLLAFKGD